MMGLADIIFKNFWPKAISFILAVATWFYVFDLVNNESFVQQRKENAQDVFEKYKFTVKEVPVKPSFTGRTPAGYRVVFEDVRVEPPRVAVFAPEDTIAEITELKTDRIDLSEYTRPTILRVGILSDTKPMTLQDKIVEVYVPVVKMTENGPPKAAEAVK